MLVNREEDYRCLVYCGDENCVCGAKRDDKERILMNLEHELGTKFIVIPKGNVRNEPIRKKRRRK